jgi:hypothetical protein
MKNNFFMSTIDAIMSLVGIFGFVDNMKAAFARKPRV